MRRKTIRQYLRRCPTILREVLLHGRYHYTFDLMPMCAEAMSWRKRLNLLSAGLNLAYRRARPWAWPIHMQVELTNVCDLRCPVCPTGAGQMRRPRAFMDMNLFRRLMDEAAPRLLGVFLWAWGEPLLHPRFDEAVRIVRGHGAIPVLSTNGQALDDGDVADRLCRCPPEYLIVAVDGLTDKTHGDYRTGASLPSVLRGVRRLAEVKRRLGLSLPRLHMRFMAMKHNEHELPQVRAFAAANGFDVLTIRALSIIDADESAHRRMVPSTPEYRAYQYGPRGRLRRRDFLCQHAFGFPTVLVDGTVVPCDQDSNAQQPYGRLEEGVRFADLWFGPRAAAIRRVIRGRRDRLSFCRQCPYADRLTNTCSVSYVDLAAAGGA